MISVSEKIDKEISTQDRSYLMEKVHDKTFLPTLFSYTAHEHSRSFPLCVTGYSIPSEHRFPESIVVMLVAVQALWLVEHCV